MLTLCLLWSICAGIIVLAVGMMGSIEERRREEEEAARHKTK